MKKKELIERIEALEAEVEELKSKPAEIVERHYYHGYYHYSPCPVYVGDPDPPYFSTYPWRYTYTIDGTAGSCGSLTTSDGNFDSTTTDTAWFKVE